METSVKDKRVEHWLEQGNIGKNRGGDKVDKENAIIKQVTEFLKGQFDISEIFLFGSIIGGNFTGDSDIDIALFIKDYETRSLKDFARAVFYIQNKISSRIELHFFPDKLEPLTFSDYVRNTGKKVA